MIRIKAFRAIDDEHRCNLYVREHMEILKIFGITKITTANNSWMYNPSVYVIMAEGIDDNKPLGGARIHLYDASHPLPFVEAVKDFDANVHTLVANHAKKGTAEMCGLWNSRDIAGYGIGTLFLARACVTIAAQLPLHSMFVLCGEHTIGVTLEKGFTIEKNLGNNGTFYYPKEGLVATAAVMEDIYDLSNAKDTDRKIIEDLRANPDQKRVDIGPKGEVEIEYRLKLS